MKKSSDHGKIGHNSGDKPKPLTDKQRSKRLYERRRAAGWKRDWMDPDTIRIAKDLGGIEHVGREVTRMTNRIEELEDEASELRQQLDHANRDRWRWLRPWPFHRRKP